MANKMVYTCDQCQRTTDDKGLRESWVQLGVTDWALLSVKAPDAVSGHAEGYDLCSWGCVADFTRCRLQAAVDMGFRAFGEGGG